MSWKKKLAQLEVKKQWDQAIDFLKNIIEENPNDLDAYLFMNFLLMNLLVEENYNKMKYDYYALLLKKYFNESYKKFYKNPKYLFYTSITGYMSEWYFDRELEDLKKMMLHANILDANNDLYKWAYYGSLNLNDITSKKEAACFAEKILAQNSLIKKELDKMGALGSYLFSIMYSWAKNVLLSDLNQS